MKAYKSVRILFFVISLMILALGFFAPNGNITATVMGLLAFGALIALHIFTPQIAGLSADNPKVRTMRRLNYAFMALMVGCFGAINWLPQITALPAEAKNILNIAIAAAIMIVIGNAAPKLPFNRYIGLRLPWTVRDERTWKVAHKLLGYLTFPLVAVMVIGCFFVSATELIKWCVIAWVAIPGLYSAWYYYGRIKSKR